MGFILADNSKILFLKVPQGDSIPVGKLRCYAAYLWVKKFNRKGVISHSDIHPDYRNRFNYWIKKLVSAGFVSKHDGYYSIRSYQHVWRILGVKRFKTQSGHLKFKYWKITVDSEKTFLKDIKDGVFRHLANRKKNQIAYRLANGNNSLKLRTRKLGTFVNLSGRSAAKLFGYKYFSSGLKYRDQYFKVRKGDRFSFLDHNGVKCFKNECAKISLY